MSIGKSKKSHIFYSDRPLAAMEISRFYRERGGGREFDGIYCRRLEKHGMEGMML